MKFLERGISFATCIYLIHSDISFWPGHHLVYPSRVVAATVTQAVGAVSVSVMADG